MATEVLTGFVLVYCEYLEMFSSYTVNSKQIDPINRVERSCKSNTKEKSDFVLFNGDIMTTDTLLSCFCFTLGVVFAFAACPIDWSEFQGECLHFSRASRGWIDAAVS